jgi:hypothetical protein
MTVSTVKRSAFKTFLNTGTTETPVWSLVGEGITTGTINYNPETSSETYIHQDSGVTMIDSYKPTMPIEATCKAGDTVFDFVDGKRQARAVLAAAQVEIVNVWLYEAEAGGAYPAERQAANLQIDSFGGDGGASAKISYTINFEGDPTIGTFNPSTLAFVANP